MAGDPERPLTGAVTSSCYPGVRGVFGSLVRFLGRCIRLPGDSVVSIQKEYDVRTRIHVKHPNFSPSTMLYHQVTGARSPSPRRALTPPTSTTPSPASVTQSGREPRLVRNRGLPDDARMTGLMKCGRARFSLGFWVSSLR